MQHIRKRAIIDLYHMEPDLMIRYTEKYGPLDWRHPAAHALYWAQRGVERGLDRATERTQGDYDFTNTDRLVVQSIQELYRSGRVYYDINNPDFYLTLQHEDFIPTYGNILDEIAARSEFDADRRAYSALRAGYENFMMDAIMFLYRRGQVELAEEYRIKLLTWDKANINDPERVFKLSLPLDEFVRFQIRDDERHTNPTTARGQINGALYSAFLDGLGARNQETFVRNYTFAREFHKIYTETQAFNTAVSRAGPEGQVEGRMEVVHRDFEEHAARVLSVLIQQMSDPATGVQRGAIMYQGAPISLQARTYRILAEGWMYESIRRGDPETAEAQFNMWFPPPAGMELFIEQLEAQRAEDAERADMEQR